MTTKITITYTEDLHGLNKEIVEHFWKTSETWAKDIAKPEARLPNGERPHKGTIMEAKRRANDARTLADTLGVHTGPHIVLVK